MNGEEEPFALANEGGVLATIACLGLESLAGLGNMDFGGLECFLGLPDGADWGSFGDTGDEPVALVMSAEELTLVLAFPDQKQQMTVGRLNIEDGNFGF